MDTRPSEPEFVDTFVNVRYAETDQMGIVHHSNYFVWFEAGRVAWCKAKGFRYTDLEREHGRFIAVAEASCRFRKPARFEDELLVRTAVASATDKVIRYQYEVRNTKSGELLATGETTHVVTDTQLRTVRIPDEYRHCFNLPRK